MFITFRSFAHLMFIFFNYSEYSLEIQKKNAVLLFKILHTTHRKKQVKVKCLITETMGSRCQGD